MYTNDMTKKVFAGKVPIGGGAPVTVQSMLCVPAHDIAGNKTQAKALEKAGCDIVRISVPDTEAVKTLAAVKESVNIPVVADIHFDYKLALESVAAGADKIRINPGNIGSDDRVKAVADACRTAGVPIRIGVNSGSVEKNILAVLESRKELTPAERKNKMDELIERFSISHIRKQPAYTLSGGERRRTEIARALAGDPYFLLLDEPFAGIDPIAVYEIKKIISKLSQDGIGILITDHNVRDTLEITQRACIISDGRIVVEGSKEEILQSEIARKIYLGEQFSM